MNFAIINPEYNAPINNFRQILAPLIVLHIYCQLQLQEESKKTILKVLCWTIIIVFTFGIYEQITSFWSVVNLKVYFNLKGIPTDSNGVSYMFYEPMFGYRERMTSAFLDPVSLGHFFSSAGIFLFYLKKKKRIEKLALVLCLAGLILALSKGAIIQLFIGIFLLNLRIPLFIRLCFASLPFILLSFIENKTGILIHISGFLSSIENITMFGHGVGSVGNYAKMFSNDLTTYYRLGISDTFVGSLVGQMGIIGMMGWLTIGWLIIFYSGRNREEVFSAFRIFASIFVVSILSENTMNITSFLLPAVLTSLSMQIKESPSYNLNIAKQ